MKDGEGAFILICAIVTVIGMVLISWDLGWKAAVGITLISAVSSARIKGG